MTAQMPCRNWVGGGPSVFDGFDSFEGASSFGIRRAVERLREGLFDPCAVRLLTASEERLREAVELGLRAAEAGEAPHLCILGAYGRGKSHSLLYIQDLASSRGFVTSCVNLDPREISLSNPRRVFRELMARLQFPDGSSSFPCLWKTWAREQTRQPEFPVKSIVGLIPDRMPHRFKSVLAALASRSVPQARRENLLKKPAAFRPGEFSLLLERALNGEAIPSPQLAKVLKYRQVPFYREGPLGPVDNESVITVIEAISALFRRMGYRGWVLLFDEGESAVQGSVSVRSRSYRFLHRFFARGSSRQSFLYPVFAFTEDFFQQVQEEDYHRRVRRRGAEVRLFDCDYAREWQGLNLFRLHDLSRSQWQELSRKLLCLHGRAYDWEPPRSRLIGEMAELLDAMGTLETRLKLKALVEWLDLAHQEQVL